MSSATSFHIPGSTEHPVIQYAVRQSVKQNPFTQSQASERYAKKDN